MKQFKDYIVEYEISHDGHGNYRDDEGNTWTSKSGGAHRSSFGRRHTITSHQPDHPHSVHINGKKWKTFGSHSHASNVAKKIKGATVHKEEVELDEMDKSQSSHGRDGKISHSTYGSRDKGGSNGPDKTAKATTADKMMKHAHDVMMKSMSQADKVKKGWAHPSTLNKEEVEQIDELSDTTLTNYAQKVHDDSLKHDKDPSKRSAAKRSKSVMGFSRALNKLESRPHKEHTDMCNVCGQTPCNCTHISEGAPHEKDLDEKKPVTAQGVKGMKSKPFTKHFKTLKHFHDWADSEKSGDHEVHRVYQKEEVEINELSSGLLQRYKDKARAHADKLSSSGQHAKANKRLLSHMKATGKQIEKTTANIKKALQ